MTDGWKACDRDRPRPPPLRLCPLLHSNLFKPENTFEISHCRRRRRRRRLHLYDERGGPDEPNRTELKEKRKEREREMRMRCEEWRKRRKALSDCGNQFHGETRTRLALAPTRNTIVDRLGRRVESPSALQSRGIRTRLRERARPFSACCRGTSENILSNSNTLAGAVCLLHNEGVV